MTHEVRNLKGEIISDSDPDEKWYQLSTSTWLLIGGLIIFNVGCFVKPSVIDSLFRLLDVRLWPWWYFLCLLILVAFSVKWFFIYQNWDDYDDMDAEAARRFKIMSIIVSIEMLVIVLLYSSGMTSTLGYPLYQWMTYGTFSWWAVLMFFVLVAIIALTFYFVKEWIVTFGSNR